MSLWCVEVFPVPPNILDNVSSNQPPQWPEHGLFMQLQDFGISNDCALAIKIPWSCTKTSVITGLIQWIFSVFKVIWLIVIKSALVLALNVNKYVDWYRVCVTKPLFSPRLTDVSTAGLSIRCVKTVSVRLCDVCQTYISSFNSTPITTRLG